jgi:hypothetical protein
MQQELNPTVMDMLRHCYCHTEGLVRPNDDPVRRAAEQTMLHNDATFVPRLSTARAGDAVQGEEVAVSSQHCVRLRIVAILGDQLRLKQEKSACGQSISDPVPNRRPPYPVGGPAFDLLSFRPLRENVLCAIGPADVFSREEGKKQFPHGTPRKFARKLTYKPFKTSLLIALECLGHK